MAKKAAAVRHRTTMEILRKDVLGLTREQIAFILGTTAKTIYLIENDDRDRIAFDQIRILYEYAQDNQIRWPARLISDLLVREDFPGH